jgi:microcompartment protein CcmK/EutM
LRIRQIVEVDGGDVGEAEVVVDRVGAGIEALIDELLAEPHDPVI